MGLKSHEHQNLQTITQKTHELTKINLRTENMPNALINLGTTFLQSNKARLNSNQNHETAAQVIQSTIMKQFNIAILHKYSPDVQSIAGGVKFYTCEAPIHKRKENPRS